MKLAPRQIIHYLEGKRRTWDEKIFRLQRVKSDILRARELFQHLLCFKIINSVVSRKGSLIFLVTDFGDKSRLQSRFVGKKFILGSRAFFKLQSRRWKLERVLIVLMPEWTLNKTLVNLLYVELSSKNLSTLDNEDEWWRGGIEVYQVAFVIPK